MKKYLIVMILLSVVFISGCVEERHKITYMNHVFTFPGDLNRAALVPIYPNEQAVEDMVLDARRDNLFIAFYNDTGEVQYYASPVWELTVKLQIVKELNYDKRYTLDTIPINDISELDQYRSNNTLLILLTGPSRTNRNAITVSDNLITLEAKALKSGNYTELEMVTARLISAVME